MRRPAQAPSRADCESQITQLLKRLGPRRQAILIAAGAAILLINVALLAWTSQQSQSQAKLASHSVEVENKLSELLLLLRTAESEQRAYLLVGAKPTAYHASYLEALTQIQDKAADIRAMIADNPAQQSKLAALDSLIQEKLEDLALKVRLFDDGDSASALGLFLQEKGRALMTEIGERVSVMKLEEERLLAERSADSMRASQQLFLVGLGDTVLIFLLGWVAISFSLLETQSLEMANAALEAKVEARVADLREANDELQSFTYVVGHDLRAPLVNIMGFTSELEMLRETIFKTSDRDGEPLNGTPLDKQAAASEFDEAIGFIKAATTKMERLIGAILMLSRTGKREMRPEVIDMSALVNGVVAALAHQAQAVGAQIEVASLPEITCDRLALEQVFANLLDNALKYLRPEEPGRNLDYRIRDAGTDDLRGSRQWSRNRGSRPKTGFRPVPPRRRAKPTGRRNRTGSRACAGPSTGRNDQAYVCRQQRLDLPSRVASFMRRSLSGDIDDAREHCHDRR